MTFALHWQGGRDVLAVINLDKSAGPFEAAKFDLPDEKPDLVVPLALTFSRDDFLGFLEARTRYAGEQVKFAATQAGLDNLARLFPGTGRVDVDMPLPTTTTGPPAGDGGGG